jgi:PAS domain S-box-containing protein
VDDLPANRLALRAILEPLGQNLVEAASGEEALSLLQDEDFAVVLLDVQMEGLDGFETAQHIRNQEKTRGTPIIFLTAYEDNRLAVVEAYQLGAVDYLVKPLIPEIVQAKVRVFVELFQKTEQLKRQAGQLREAEHQARLQVEAALRDSEERHRLWVQAVKDYAIFHLDPDGRITSWNEGGERLTGFVRDEIIGKPLALLFTAGDRQAGIPDKELAAARSEGRATDENWIARKDGSRFWASGYSTALFDEGGRLRGFVKICRDLTDQKRLEQLLRQRATELAEADRRKNEFLAMLGHELRNPLAPIRNAVHVLEQGGNDPTLTQWAKEVVERQVRHMTRLVDDLLDVSRIAQGKVQVQRTRLDLSSLVRSTAEEYRPALQDAGLRLQVDVPHQPVWVTGDATRLTQVVGNLLDNARKFTDAGGEVSLRLAVNAHAAKAAVSVRDTGIGLAPEMVRRVFDLFEQADRGLGRSRGGLGVGLALVKALVELHGGEVQASSPGPGQGAEFSFWIPLAHPPADLPEAPAIPVPATTPLRVLIIDDNRDAADSQRVLLEANGHRVFVAYRADSGLEEARRVRPKVVLCDIGVPGVDGYEICRTLRRDPATASARLIAITGYGSQVDKARAQEAGFTLHLTKPVDPSALLRAVEGAGVDR